MKEKYEALISNFIRIYIEFVESDRINHFLVMKLDRHILGRVTGIIKIKRWLGM